MTSMASGEADAQQVPTDSLVETVNLEDFVDVVYSYKCKFCSFSSNNPQGISGHVVQAHLVQGKKQPATAVAGAAAATTATATAIEGVTSEPASTQPTQDVTEAVSNTEELQASQTGSDEQTQIFPGNVALVQYDSEMQTTVTAPESMSTKPAQSDASAQFNSEAVTAFGGSTQSGESREVENLIIIENRNQQPKVDERAMTEDLGAPNIEQGDYRELFVCGQCSVGFTDIEECKMHMINEHNISAVETTYETGVGGASPEREYLGPNRVSVATQVQLNRKPGRKRKGEVDVGKIIVKKEPAAVVTQKLEHTDLSLITKRMAGVEGKRVVRPPKNLVEDYFIGRQKRKSPRRPVCRLLCSQKRCRARFRTKAAQEIHEKSHREVRDLNTGSTHGIFTCVECDQSFGSWKPLQMHMWKDHQIDTDLCKCSYCEFRADSWQKVEVHAETHNEENPFECDLCGASFKRQSQLSKHMVEHTGEEEPAAEGATEEGGEAEGEEGGSSGSVVSRPRSYRHPGLSPVCSICGRNFSNMKCLKSHMELVHQKQKPFTCKYCGYTTGRKAMLDLHIRTHTGEKPFKCDLCNYQTSDHNTMRRHRMRHTGDRPYKCQFCPYQCIQSISLKTHLKNKHPGTASIFSCSQCQYHTVNKAYYLNHLEDHKRGLVEDTGAADKATTKAKAVAPQKSEASSNSSQPPLVASGSTMSFVPSSSMISIAAKEAELIQESGVVMSLQVGEATQGAGAVHDARMQSLVVHPQELPAQPEPMDTANPQEQIKLTPLEAAETFTIEAPGGQPGTYLGMVTQDQHGTPSQVILTIQTGEGEEQQLLVPAPSNATYEPTQNIISTMAPMQTQPEGSVVPAGAQQGEVIQVSVADSGAGLQHIITAIENMNEAGVDGMVMQSQAPPGSTA